MDRDSPAVLATPSFGAIKVSVRNQSDTVTRQALLTGRVARDTVLITLAGVMGKAAAVVTVPFLARRLDPTGYGRADLAYTTAVLLIVVVSFAGDIPAARAHARADSDDSRRRVLRAYVWATLALSVVVALALVPLRSAIASALWASPSDTALATGMLILVPVAAVQAALANIQRLRGRAGLFATLSFIDLMAQLVLAVGLVAAGFGPMGVIMGYIGGSFVGLFAAAWPGRDVLGARVDWRQGTQLVVAGTPFLPPVLAFLIADNISRVLIAHDLGVSSVGVFGIAVRAASVMSLVAGAFTLAWGPIGLGLSPSRESRTLFGTIFTTYLQLAVVAAVGLGSLAPEVARFLGGNGYQGAAGVMPGLLFSTGTTGALFVLATAAGVSARAADVALSAIEGAVLQVLLSFALLPSLGLPAIGIAAIIGRLTNLGLLSRSVRGVVDARWRRLIAETLLGAILAAGLQQTAVSSAQLTPVRWSIAVAAGVIAMRLTVLALRARVQLTHQDTSQEADVPL